MLTDVWGIEISIEIIFSCAQKCTAVSPEAVSQSQTNNANIENAQITWDGVLRILNTLKMKNRAWMAFRESFSRNWRKRSAPSI